MRAYEVGALLGRGGMGAVFRARRRADGRPIALKIMSSQANPERFRREAEALARIAHPNVVRVLDFGEEAGGLFLAMEFVEGESLEERIRRQGALPVEDALGWTRALAGALRHVHARGVVHRDIKPENVMIREDGSACLVDFGLALTLDDDRLTKTGQVLGTLAYAAPELLLGRPEAVGPPADVFSLGATLYALLTGSAPIPDGLFGAMLIQAQDVMPPAPRTFCSGVPPDLDRVCMACLAKDPAQRPTLTALIESLDACARSEGRTSWVLVAAGLLVLGLILAGTALVDSERLDPSQELAPALGSQVVERLTVSASGSGAPSAPASPLEESRRDWPRPNDPLAFPDASGAGRAAKGGRSGREVSVTSLKDSGPGSLRAAIATSDRRQPLTVVFDVAGAILLKRSLVIGRSRVTVAGQTAPAGGITICGTEEISITGDDVVIQHLRFRSESPRVRSVRVSGSDVVLDQLTLTRVFAIGCDRFTMQRCLVTGVGVQLKATRPSSRVSFRRNVFAPAGSTDTALRLEVADPAHSLEADVVDCVFYDTGRGIKVLGKGVVNLDVFGNSLVAGIHHPLGRKELVNELGVKAHSISLYPLVLVTKGTPPCRIRHAGNGRLYVEPLDPVIWTSANDFMKGGFSYRTAGRDLPPFGARVEVLREAGARRWARNPNDARLVPSVTFGGASDSGARD